MAEVKAQGWLKGGTRVVTLHTLNWFTSITHRIRVGWDHSAYLSLSLFTQRHLANKTDIPGIHLLIQ